MVRAVQKKFAGADPMVACYIEPAFEALLVFAFKYAEDPVNCLLKSVNAGGENLARSSVLGSMVSVCQSQLKFLTFR